MAKAIPVVMDAGALSDAAAADGHAHDGQHRTLPGPAPVRLRVGGVAIDESEIAREMQHHRSDDPHHAHAAAARTLVVRMLVRLECARLGLLAGPEAGETEDEALVRQLLAREVRSPVPDQDAVDRYYHANRERLREPDRIRIEHILIPAAPDDSGARQRARAQAEILIAQLRDAPGRFQAFAAEHSACPSREQGGDLGWITHGDTVPEFERQIFMLRQGMAGLPVETRYGYHVVRVLAAERGAPLAPAEAGPRILAYLETQARQNAVHDYLQGLRERWPVEGLDQIESAA